MTHTKKEEPPLDSEAAPAPVESQPQPRQPAKKTVVATKPSAAPSSNKGPDSLLYSDEVAIRAAIQAVRNDVDSTNWFYLYSGIVCDFPRCLVSFVKGKNNTIELLGTGSGDTDEMVSKLSVLRFPVEI